jgi:hypothetical protein
MEVSTLFKTFPELTSVNCDENKHDVQGEIEGGINLERVTLIC